MADALNLLNVTKQKIFEDQNKIIIDDSPEIVVDVLDILNHQLRVASVFNINILNVGSAPFGDLHNIVGDVHGLDLVVLGLGWFHVSILLVHHLLGEDWLLWLLERLCLLVTRDRALSVLQISERRSLKITCAWQIKNFNILINIVEVNLTN